jgi:TonB family protein
MSSWFRFVASRRGVTSAPPQRIDGWHIESDPPIQCEAAMKIRRVLLSLVSVLLLLLVAPAGAQTMRKAVHSSEVSAYRSGAAQHIYRIYANSIYKGMLPPLMHAIVVVETEVDALGRVKNVRVVRSPSHAPDVTESVVGMINSASPFPAPGNAAGTRFIEVWLVDRSGRFQLHALTEGQH